MRKDLVKYQDDDYNVEIEVGQATVAMGLARSEKWFEIRTEATKEKPLLTRVGILQTYPACIAGTLSVRNLPMLDEEGEVVLDGDGKAVLYPCQLKVESLSVAGYLELPETLATMWKDAIYKLNPHWLPVLTKATTEGEAEEPSKETS